MRRLSGFTGFVDGVADARERFGEVDTSEVRLPPSAGFVLVACPSGLDGGHIFSQLEADKFRFREGIAFRSVGGFGSRPSSVGGIGWRGRIDDQECGNGVEIPARQGVALVRAEQKRFDLQFPEQRGPQDFSVQVTAERRPVEDFLGAVGLERRGAVEFERPTVSVKQQQSAEQSLFSVVANRQKTYRWQRLRTAQGQPLSRINQGNEGDWEGRCQLRRRDGSLVGKHRAGGPADLNTLADREFGGNFAE